MVYNIKAVCRDGGAVERARFEIVLCRNVYKGSNPFLCATVSKGFSNYAETLFYLILLCTVRKRIERKFERLFAFEFVENVRVNSHCHNRR